MDSSKLVEQALRALQAAPDFNNQTSSQMDWGNALAHLMQNQNQNLDQNLQNQNPLQNNQNQTQANSLPSNSNGDSSSSPAPSNTPPDVSLQSNVSLKLENNNNQITDNALSSLYNSLLATTETSSPISSAITSNGMLPSFAELSPNIGSANRNKLAKRDPVNLADNERLALVNKRASDRKAAQKYRRKKKLEMDVLVSENSHLKDRSKELENQLEQATTAIRMLGEQINTHGIGNQGTPPCQNCNTYEQQMKELLTRNAELEKSIKGQNVLEELLSQYAKSQTQNALQKANTEWWAENRDSTFSWKNNVVLLFYMKILPNKKPNKSVRNSKKKKFQNSKVKTWFKMNLF